ncbi:hypothetical protein EXE49_13195 [Halorubrum sp. ASP121]|jgi:hypothetical protein|uniref:hypothetical protein n=1 Tax=Halorubrum sp. Atlit-28R TaxID=2282129 RepID=UPI000EF27585|nr:hypothetical protein [Halorubrum sp. Atlit-28R]RLM51683.1 hypothetical protein DVK06_04595 [Halorubrum sp. Atlit-28R]TKX41562.1 hypothetical protein EXE50_15795 [Halorubrum sp. ARQ200]TKX49169.1 hypothetical protein EXE49_13195 [Halorubrum sp. ASP121]
MARPRHRTDLRPPRSAARRTRSVRRAALVGLSLATLGVAVFAANALLVIRRHSPGTLARVALGPFGASLASGGTDGSDGDGHGTGEGPNDGDGPGDGPAAVE